MLVVDATAGATDQDAAIAGEADRLGRGIIIVANKWDLMKGQGSEFVKQFDETLRRQLKFLDYAPILHLSAATGERTPKLLEQIDRVAASRRMRVKTHALNTLVERISLRTPAPEPGPAPRPHPLCGPDRRGAAHVRVLHQRGHVLSLFLRAVPHEPAAGGVRLRGHAHPAAGPRPPAQARGARPERLKLPDILDNRMTPKLFRAVDVCELAQLQPYVLRSWEKEFPGIGVQKDDDSPRLYRQSDVDQVLRIKQLVFSEGLTLAGARRRLEETTPRTAAEERREVAEVLDALASDARTRIAHVRDGLRSILQMLSAAPGTVVVVDVPRDQRAGEDAGDGAGADAARQGRVAKSAIG